jgi:hypothetical protein
VNPLDIMQGKNPIKRAKVALGVGDTVGKMKKGSTLVRLTP